jgi:hypothetical protein
MQSDPDQPNTFYVESMSKKNAAEAILLIRHELYAIRPPEPASAAITPALAGLMRSFDDARAQGASSGAAPEHPVMHGPGCGTDARRTASEHLLMFWRLRCISTH